ncbi:major facilitator superfamily transporter [Pseudomonas putida S11]|nr:major facilitator superfamily transporter [Pseudomonas putida S11]
MASNYYAQPLLHSIAQQFGLSTASAGSIVIAAQLSYGAGLLLLAPLGDLFEQRRLITVMTAISTLGLVISACAPSLPWLILGTALTGLFSVVAQILVPMAATLSEPHQRGRAVGTLMSGLLLGILLARTAAGFMAELGGWRSIYVLAALLMAITAVALYRSLPQHHSHAGLKIPSADRLGVPPVPRRTGAAPAFSARPAGIQPVRPVLDATGVPAGERPVSLFGRGDRPVRPGRCSGCTVGQLGGSPGRPWQGFAGHHRGPGGIAAVVGAAGLRRAVVAGLAAGRAYARPGSATGAREQPECGNCPATRGAHAAECRVYHLLLHWRGLGLVAGHAVVPAPGLDGDCGGRVGDWRAGVAGVGVGRAQAQERLASGLKKILVGFFAGTPAPPGLSLA